MDGDTVYWTSAATNGRVLSRKKGGNTVVVLARDQKQPTRIALDDTHVYWTCAGDGTVRRTAKATNAKR